MHHIQKKMIVYVCFYHTFYIALRHILRHVPEIFARIGHLAKYSVCRKYFVDGRNYFYAKIAA